MAKGVFRLSAQAQQSLSEYAKTILAAQRTVNTELYNKLASIDYAYFMYTTKKSAGEGTDIVHAETVAGDVFNDEFTMPIVVSQVDSYVGYLAEVYLSGYPLFPVVSTPDHRQEGEKLEAIIDSHANVGAYPRELLKSFYNGIKYNFMPLMIDWDILPYYHIATELIKPTEGAKIEKADYGYSNLKSLDAYNSIWDIRYKVGEVATRGEYGGFTEIIGRVELNKLLTKYNKEGTAYNANAAYKLGLSSPGGASVNFLERPNISEYVSTYNPSRANGIDWLAWMRGSKSNHYKQINYSGMYERSVLFCRIIPSEHSITNVPSPNTPQIWKLDVIYPGVVIHAKRIISYLDQLPMMIGQPLEDDFALQTHSIAERGIPFQEISSKLLNIRFAGARRAVSDRALYDTGMVRSSDINAPVAAAKIPVTIPITSNKTIGDAYEQIPYNDRATEGVVQDALRVISFADSVNGGNEAQQGQFVKGNKTRTEWNDVMGASNNRMRLPALTLEYQVFNYVKNQIKLNIFQFGSAGVYQNYRTGEPLNITEEDLETIKNNLMAFKTADGFTPSSKIIPPDLLIQGMQLIGQSPILQQTFGIMLPSMFAHMMTLGGVPGIEQYIPSAPEGAAPPITPNSAAAPVE